MLRAVYAELARALDVTICFFGMYDAASQSVEVVWQMHYGRELPGGRFPLGQGPTSRAIRERRPQLIRRWSAQGPRVQIQYATDRPDLPESSVVVPAIAANEVIGVLAVQTYRPDAYCHDDVAFVQGIADRVAIAVAAKPSTVGGQPDQSDLERVEASARDALLVLDERGCLVRLNRSARELLSAVGGSVVFGHPVDRAQADRWPLGTRALTEQVRPLVDQLKRGETPDHEVELALDDRPDHHLRCRASVLLKHGAPAGGLMVLHEIA
jgi:GAF domain-containing protein